MSQKDLIIPLEILEVEIKPKLDFYTLISFLKTCRAFFYPEFYSEEWRRWVEELPSPVVKRCDNKQLSMFRSLTSLNLSDNSNISNDGFANLTSLKTLILPSKVQDGHITHDAFEKLTSLTYLSSSYTTEYTYLNVEVSNKMISHLTNLTYLDLRSIHTNRISDSGVSNLTSLTYLNPGYAYLTENSLLQLSKLSTLDVFRNRLYIDYQHLTNLTDLTLCDLYPPPAARVDLPPSLIKLDIRRCMAVTDASLISLTCLESLTLGNNRSITDVGLKMLTTLTHLDLGHNTNITDNGINLLTRLTSLTLGFNRNIGPRSIIAKGPNLLPYSPSMTRYANLETYTTTNITKSYVSLNLSY